VIYAATRGIRVVIEQPLNSLLFKFSDMEAAISLTEMSRFTSCMGGFGFRTLKRLEFFATGNVSSTSLIRGVGDFKKPEGSTDLAPKTPRSISGAARKGWKRDAWVTGSKSDLKDSARYPIDFAEALAQVATAGLSQAGRLALQI